jgi:hypothetical protein
MKFCQHFSPRLMAGAKVWGYSNIIRQFEVEFILWKGVMCIA